MQRRGSHDNQMGPNPRAGMVYHHNLNHNSRPPRRGVSVPDLDSTSNNIESSESPITVEVEHEDEMHNNLSPR